MDAYEATKIVFSRIQSIDPENAAKIMGLLLIQDHGEKEMIRLAFGPESLLQSVVLNARKDLGFLPPSSSSPALPASPVPPAPTANPFVIAGQNPASRLIVRPPPLVVSSPSSWTPSSPFSRSGDEIHSGGDELIDEIHLHDQLSFLNDPVASGGDELLSYGMGWGSPVSNGGNQRRNSSISDFCFGSDPSGLGWKPCLYFARGYCKNGSSCRFLHGLVDEAKMDAVVEQEFLLRSKSQRLMASAASAFPYSPTGSSLPQSPSGTGKCMSFLLQQQQQSESQRAAVAAAAAAALMLGGDDPHKFMGRPRMERSDFSGMMNPSSRQIYLTFPADSTFREEDVSNYFSIYGPVQDVRIPYQQKRMFGFVTFVYPETVKLILAKGNPHFVCDARVLVKPYKEKGKVPDKFRKQVDRGDFSGCNTPTSMDSRDPFDLHQLGARMLYAGSNQDAVLRRKLEEQQELQQAIELQQRRFMGLQLLDLKRNAAISSTSTVVSPPPFPITNVLTATASEGDKSLRLGSGTATAVCCADQEEIETKASPKEDGDFQESSVEHNLPDSPFAMLNKSFASDEPSIVAEAEPAGAASASSALLASIRKFRSSRKGISALAISADGTMLAAAAGLLKVFSCTDHSKIHKFSGHPVSVRCMIFSEDGKSILTSGVGERHIAIWKIDGEKKKSASCVLSMEHPAIFLDSRGSDKVGSKLQGLYVLALSEIGVCYFWYGNSIEELQNARPTKILPAIESSMSKRSKNQAIFTAKLDSIVRSAVGFVHLAHGSLIKPSFEKLAVENGVDMSLNTSKEGLLFPVNQSFISNKGKVVNNAVTTLDSANAEDAILPIPKLHVNDKKRKHGTPYPAVDFEKAKFDIDTSKRKSSSSSPKKVPMQITEVVEPMYIEDRLRAAGLLDGEDKLKRKDFSSGFDDAIMHDSLDFTVDVNLPRRKIRSQISKMRADDACKLLELLVSSWKTSRSSSSKHLLSWIYYIIVIHGQFIISRDSSPEVLDNLEKMTRLKSAAIHPLLKLSGRFQLIMTQIDRAWTNQPELPLVERIDFNEDEEEDEDDDGDIDEVIYDEDDESGSDD